MAFKCKARSRLAQVLVFFCLRLINEKAINRTYQYLYSQQISLHHIGGLFCNSVWLARVSRLRAWSHFDTAEWNMCMHFTVAAMSYHLKLSQPTENITTNPNITKKACPVLAFLYFTVEKKITSGWNIFDSVYNFQLSTTKCVNA